MKSLEGKVASQGFAQARAFVTNDPRIGSPFEDYILVTQSQDPEISPLLYGAKGVITEVGGLMSHLGVVSRELSIPCVTACKGCYKEIKTGDLLKIDAGGRLNSITEVKYDSQA